MILLEALLVLDGEVRAGGALVLASDVVGDLLVFGLFDGRLIVLGPLTKDALLNKIDTLI